MQQDLKQCRICFDDNDQRNLISPCLCSGSSKYIHKHCLEEWRRTSQLNYYRCPTCHYHYKISRIWWGDLLAWPGTSIIAATASILAAGYATGTISSSCLNYVYYYFYHMPYHSPHRMQVLFHGLAWIGIPGLITGVIDFLSSPIARRLFRDDGVRPQQQYHQPSVVHHYHHYDQQQPTTTTADTTAESSTEPNDDDDKDDKKTEKAKKKPPVAPYKPKPTLMWIGLGIGTCASFYYSYKKIYKICQKKATESQHFIQNI